MNAISPLPSTFSPNMRVADALTASWLSEVTLLLRREVCWLWHQRGVTHKQNEDHLPPAIDTTSESLDLLRFADEKQRFFSSDVTAKYLSESIRSLRVDRNFNQGPWASMQKRLDLDDAAQLVLALAVLGRIDPSCSAIIATCNNNPQKTSPTLALAYRLYDSADDMLAIDSAHALFRYGVIQFSGSHDIHSWHHSYEVSSLITNVLVRDDDRVPNELRVVSTEDGIIKMNLVFEASISALISPIIAPEFIPLQGDSGTDFEDWLSLISYRTGRLLVEATHAVLPSTARLTALATWCWFYDADFVLPLMSTPIGEHLHDRAPWPDIPIRWYAPIQDLQAIKSLPAHALKPTIVLPNTDFDMRVVRLRHALGHHASKLEKEILESARRFRLSATAIKAAGLAAKQIENLDGEQLQAICRSQVRLNLGSLAQVVTPRFQFKELVLPPAQALQLEEIVHAMRSLTRVHYQWGTARAWNDAGLSVIFCGPSGTGKTMAAEAIAEELQLPMFRIDLSQVVNKYIGETEKNLKKVFDAAEESDCVIFFDEADALFGKRTNVKDAHDRFANIEISYLLERMERLKGIAILATNRRKDLDEAFLRRLRYLVEFTLPGEKERERLWRYVFPGGVNINDLDIPYLARTFQFAGGHIRSIAFNACLQTKHDASASVDMLQVLSAVKRELDKLNRPNSPESFGKYEKQIKTLFGERQ